MTVDSEVDKVVPSLQAAVPTFHELDRCNPDTSPSKVGAYLGQRSSLCTSPLSHELQKIPGLVAADPADDLS